MGSNPTASAARMKILTGSGSRRGTTGEVVPRRCVRRVRRVRRFRRVRSARGLRGAGAPRSRSWCALVLWHSERHRRAPYRPRHEAPLRGALFCACPGAGGMDLTMKAPGVSGNGWRSGRRERRQFLRRRPCAYGPWRSCSRHSSSRGSRSSSSERAPGILLPGVGIVSPLVTLANSEASGSGGPSANRSESRRGSGPGAGCRLAGGSASGRFTVDPVSSAVSVSSACALMRRDRGVSLMSCPPTLCDSPRC